VSISKIICDDKPIRPPNKPAMIFLDREQSVLSPVTSSEAMCPVIIIAHPESIRIRTVAVWWSKERFLYDGKGLVCIHIRISTPWKMFRIFARRYNIEGEALGKLEPCLEAK
jgi:hypothetical protein